MAGDKTRENDKYEVLKLSNQLCFPLYACAKEIVRAYTPILKPLDLTYTQYIVLLALWERKTLFMKDLGEILYLDSGTLTPLVNRLAEKGYLSKKRSDKDARDLEVSVTQKGWELREKAVNVPYEVGSCVDLEEKDSFELARLLHKILRQF